MKKFALVFALALIGAGVLASSAGALRFETGDCYESGPGAAWICPNGFTGASYSAQLKGAGGCGPALPYQFTIQSGGLPQGLSMSSSGLISGNPTTAGTFQFYVQLSDENPPSQSWCRPATSQRLFQISILQGLSLDTTSVPTATLGVSYTARLTATPASTQTWTVSAGSLPPGLALDASTGTISGTPTAVGSYPFTVTVTDSEKRSARREFRIDVRDPLTIMPLGLHPWGLHGSEVGVAIETKLAATGGSGTFTWSLASGSLPEGLTLGQDGTISGTPTTSGAFAFVAQVTDSEQRVASLDVSLPVAAKLSIKTLALKAARVGRLYSAKLKTVGGVAPVKWKLLGGRLPRGIRFQKTLGVFAGTARRVGTYRVSVQVTDALGVTSKKTFVLVVKA